jgi:hypothetical protein
MSEKPDNSELEKILGEKASQISPAVKEIILSALKKAQEKLANKQSNSFG